MGNPAPGGLNEKIPCLDGLRAISVAMVIFGHSSHALHTANPWASWAKSVVCNAGLGVSTFFVLSGFLISTLLLRERERSGRISLRRFYLRRSLRIFPPLYAYLAILGLLALLRVLIVPPGSFAAAATFTWNYVRAPESWWVGHTWSLCIEEQFYLLWPAMLAAFTFAGARKTATAIVLLAPIMRTLSYALFPGTRPYITIMAHTRMDTLMFGCLAALAFPSPVFQAFLDRVFARKLHVIAALFVTLLQPFLFGIFRGAYMLPIGYTLEGLSITLVLLWLVRKPGSAAGRLLNSSPLTYFGVLSYSLYLWQQLFCTAINTTAMGTFPLNILAAWLAAELCHRVVEKPALRLKSRFESVPAQASSPRAAA